MQIGGVVFYPGKVHGISTMVPVIDSKGCTDFVAVWIHNYNSVEISSKRNEASSRVVVTGQSQTMFTAGLTGLRSLCSAPKQHKYAKYLRIVNGQRIDFWIVHLHSKSQLLSGSERETHNNEGVYDDYAEDAEMKRYRYAGAVIWFERFFFWAGCLQSVCFVALFEWYIPSNLHIVLSYSMACCVGSSHSRISVVGKH